MCVQGQGLCDYSKTEKTAICEGYLMWKTEDSSHTFYSKTGVIYSWYSEPGKIEFDTFYSQIILPSTHFPETANNTSKTHYFM